MFFKVYDFWQSLNGQMNFSGCLLFISHTGFKPFQCPHCKKFYRRKEILKNHIIIHAKEPFFLNNKEKYNEMMEKVKEMKHINYNYDDLDCGTKLKRKKAIFQTKTNLNKKRN